MTACFGGALPLSVPAQDDITKKANLRLELWKLIKGNDLNQLQQFLNDNSHQIKTLSSEEHGVLSPFMDKPSPLRYLFTEGKYDMMYPLLDLFSPDISTCVIVDRYKHSELENAITERNSRFIAIMLMFLDDDEKKKLIPKFQHDLELFKLFLRYLPHAIVNTIDNQSYRDVITERLALTAGDGRILDNVQQPYNGESPKKIDAIIVPRQLILNSPGILFELEEKNVVRIINHDNDTYELIPHNEAFRLASTTFPTYELRNNDTITTLEFLEPDRYRISTHEPEVTTHQPEMMAMIFALFL